jgi:hypothetical protein
MDAARIKTDKMRFEIEKLIADGKMPTAEQVLAAVAVSREKYASQIIDARYGRVRDTTEPEECSKQGN